MSTPRTQQHPIALRWIPANTAAYQRLAHQWTRLYGADAPVPEALRANLLNPVQPDAPKDFAAERFYYFEPQAESSAAEEPYLFTDLNSVSLDGCGLLILEHFHQQHYSLHAFDGQELLPFRCHDLDLVVNGFVARPLSEIGGFHHYTWNAVCEKFTLHQNWGDLESGPSLWYKDQKKYLHPQSNGVLEWSAVAPTDYLHPHWNQRYAQDPESVRKAIQIEPLVFTLLDVGLQANLDIQRALLHSLPDSWDPALALYGWDPTEVMGALECTSAVRDGRLSFSALPPHLQTSETAAAVLEANVYWDEVQTHALQKALANTAPHEWPQWVAQNNRALLVLPEAARTHPEVVALQKQNDWLHTDLTNDDLPF
jgi:hypothetical protein